MGMIANLVRRYEEDARISGGVVTQATRAAGRKTSRLGSTTDAEPQPAPGPQQPEPPTPPPSPQPEPGEPEREREPVPPPPGTPGAPDES